MTDPSAPFTPAEPISIGSGAGNIGRIYWDNQKTIAIEAQSRDGTWYRRPLAPAGS